MHRHEPGGTEPGSTELGTTGPGRTATGHTATGHTATGTTTGSAPAATGTTGPSKAEPGRSDPAAAEIGLVASAVVTLRLIIGWAAAALAVLDLAMGLKLDGTTTDVSYLVFHLILLATGVVLLAWGHLHEHPGRAGLLTGGLVTGLGMVLSTIPSTTSVCCMLEHPVRHGFPFTVLARGTDGWHLDASLVLADLVFWGCAGFLALSLIGLIEIHRQPGDSPRHAVHAEHRATPRHARVPRNENVGGLP